ncbi:hypothetical protein I6E52_07425 [Salinibacterium sp. NG253]|uniref:hypothetical protein n=1 Tax=Salinibacterium sp. NG253 TaxID=2792039 RepID=UPI0018CC8F42|nr:hypothetical protein [Salinibacterium sp. NG253]MBH0116675.1 hypothetical protein [Salinibacterium sp. NG253]
MQLQSFAAIVMLAAMLDVSLSWGLLHPLVWVMALLVSGMLVGFGARPNSRSARSAGTAAGADAAHRSGMMALHSALGLVLMAGMIMAMSSGGVDASESHHHGVAFLPPLLGGMAGYVIFTVWFERSLRLTQRSPGLLARVEVLSMGGAAGLMALALLA